MLVKDCQSNKISPESCISAECQSSQKTGKPKWRNVTQEEWVLLWYIFMSLYWLFIFTYFVCDESNHICLWKIFNEIIVLQLKVWCFFLKGLDGLNAGQSRVLCLQLTTHGTQFILKKQTSS